MESIGASRCSTTPISASSRGKRELPIFDAGRVGYPQRMREYTKRKRLESES